jgi:hypothetical protein
MTPPIKGLLFTCGDVGPRLTPNLYTLYCCWVPAPLARFIAEIFSSYIGGFGAQTSARSMRKPGSASVAAAAVAEGRRRQDQLAAKSLHAIVRALKEARCKPVVAALLVNRAGWITGANTLDTSSVRRQTMAERAEACLPICLVRHNSAECGAYKLNSQRCLPLTEVALCLCPTSRRG